MEVYTIAEDEYIMTDKPIKISSPRGFTHVAKAETIDGHPAFICWKVPEGKNIEDVNPCYAELDTDYLND
ncbi:hypothetical protein [Halalkalibacter oceani]|uniref:hypothetical protein n=1 Tax=Halalkalibacter oceani TaxID=1653776 RepID=UPI003398E67E